MHTLTGSSGSAEHPVRRLVLFGLLLVVMATMAPLPLAAQDGPGTRYIACLDHAEVNLANCYYFAENDRWREMLCNFAYYADNVGCAADLIF
jgi:hypothetical protein